MRTAAILLAACLILASCAGESARQTIIVLEQQRYVPSLLLACKIAKVFGTTVDAIFKLEEA